MKKIIFVTGNSWKYNEAQSILWKEICLEQVDIDLPEIQTTSVKEVIENKLKVGYEKIWLPIIVEDTWLEFEAWNWLPWALIKFFLKSVWNEWLIKMLEMYKNKKAKVVCYVWYFDGNEKHFFCWEVEWSISDSVRWESWFQFDKIFIPKWGGKTYAELTFEEKNNISHRRKAFEKFKEHILNKLNLYWLI